MLYPGHILRHDFACISPHCPALYCPVEESTGRQELQHAPARFLGEVLVGQDAWCAWDRDIHGFGGSCSTGCPFGLQGAELSLHHGHSSATEGSGKQEAGAPARPQLDMLIFCTTYGYQERLGKRMFEYFLSMGMSFWYVGIL